MPPWSQTGLNYKCVTVHKTKITKPSQQTNWIESIKFNKLNESQKVSTFESLWVANIKHHCFAYSYPYPNHLLAYTKLFVRKTFINLSLVTQKLILKKKLQWEKNQIQNWVLEFKFWLIGTSISDTIRPDRTNIRVSYRWKII